MSMIDTSSINLEHFKIAAETASAVHAAAWMFELDKVEGWAYWDNIFSQQECEKIISIGNNRFMMDGKILPTSASKEAIVSHSLRNSTISWIFPSQETGWIFERLASAVVSLNNQFFNFDISGMIEGLQFTKYEAPIGNYGKHVDRGPSIAPRKLSATIQLNSNSDFEGGQLALYESETPTEPQMQQGKMVLFPSYTLHEVKPVTKGTRYSLVCWITGKPFK